MSSAARSSRGARLAKARARQRVGPRAARERGLVLLALLIALMLMSIALAGALDVWSLQRRREQEKQLLFAGNQYRLAILRYYRVGRAYPASVDELLNDTRFPKPLHHLRFAYPDPITGKNDWAPMLQGDRFYGVFSPSDEATIKRAGFPRQYEDFEGAETYDGWKFLFLAPGLRTTQSNAGGLTAPGKSSSFPALSGFDGGFLPGQRVPGSR
ncbi:type II secretion system protein [Paraburkholderia nodosa]|uniref:type II secretion system protein n=1 Tax=Paraburkholderia nodosa TaxID=392320 RepID=UPI0004AF0BD2|nr:type II secretion system protein [Paraburkholderia nodosa]